MKENTVIHKRFKNFVSVLYGISYFFLIVLAFVILAVIGVGIAVPFLPVDQINTWLIEAPVELSYESQGVTVEITQEVMDSVSINQSSLLLLIGATLLVVLNFTVIAYFTNRWLKNIKNTEIFTIKNSKMIEYAAYSFIILAFLQGVMGLAVQHFAYESFNGNELLINITSFAQGSTYNFDLNIVTLFSGIFIWIIAKVFKYGVFLQDEYDQTV